MQTSSHDHYTLEIRRSTGPFFVSAIAATLFLAYGFFAHGTYIAKLGFAGYSTVMTLLLLSAIFPLSMISRRKIILIIDDRGIYHQDYKWMRWEDILSIKRKRDRGAEEREVFFLIQTPHKHEPYRISVSNLDRSEEAIIASIQKFGSYNIQEVVDEF